MTAFQIDTTDAKRGIIRIENLIDLVTEPFREAAKATADNVRTDAIGTISRQSPPRSAPFSPPGKVTGDLITSLKSKSAKPRKTGDVRAYVTSSKLRDRYAFMLESGAPSINLKPRPFLLPAAQRHADEFVERVQAALDQAIAQSTS